MPRENVCKKVYVSPEDTEGRRSWFPGATAIEFRFADDETETVTPDAFSDAIRTAAMFHGFSQKLGDSYADRKNKDGTPIELFLAMKEQLEADNWVAEGESAGPRLNLVIKAIVAAKAKAGITVTESDVAAKWHELDKDGKKSVMEDLRIKAEYERLRAEAAAERAKRAAERADATDAGSEGFAI